MTISILTTIGNEQFSGIDRQDPVYEAIDSYADLADEIVVVNGHHKSVRDKFLKIIGNRKVHIIEYLYRWPYIWNWRELPLHLNAGYGQCTGDWVIKCDIDYIFHEKNIDEIKRRLNRASGCDIATFQKFCFVTSNKYYEKGDIPIAINKRRTKNLYGFGEAINAETDLCYPIRIAGKNKQSIPKGYYSPHLHTKIGLPVYNYDYTFKDIETTKDEFFRFSAAYRRYFGYWKFGATKNKSFELFLNMMKSRFEKCPYKITIEDHPKYIQEKLKTITPEQFGYNGWNLLGK